METKRSLISAFVLAIFGLIGGGSFITGKPEELIIWIVVIIVVVIIGLIINNNNKEIRGVKLLNEQTKTENFNASTTIQNEDNRYSFSIDYERQKIRIIIAEDYSKSASAIGEANSYIFDFKDIISVEYLQDNEVSYSKSTMRTIGGGLVGGVIAGGAGAIVGGLSGSNKEKIKIGRIEVKLLVRNHTEPAFIITCYSGEPIKVDYLRNAIQEANSIVDHISVIIDKIDQESKTPIPQTSSVADELEKLCSLKEKGILTEEEFQMQKNKLLS